MGYQIPSFLKRDGDSLLFNQEGELIYYIPEMYFEKKYAYAVGVYINLIGVLDYTIVDKNGKNNGLNPFRFPSVFLCKPSVTEKIKNVQLTQHSSPQDYRLLKFKKGDQVVVSTKVPEDVVNAEEFYKMFTSGKMPTTIKYDVLHEYFQENIRLNGGDYGINMQLFGMIIAESIRDPKDIKKLFRHTDMKDMTAYQGISIKQIPKYISPFTSATSENWDESIVNAIVNKNTKYSPMESLFTEQSFNI